MDPNVLVRVCLLVSVGALCVGVAAWMLGFALGGRGAGGSALGLPVLLAGFGVLVLGAALLGGAGLDAVTAGLDRLRRRRTR